MSEDMSESPDGRIGHICATDRGYMFVLGGYHGYNDELRTNYLSAEDLWIYDSLIEKWFKKKCCPETDQSDIPSGTSGACGCIISGYLYMFGGYTDDGNSNHIYRLDLKTLKWKLLDPSGKRPIACDKSVCWEYDNKLYIFAGYGCVPTEPIEERNYQFVLDPKSHWHYKRGWNNQLVCYNIALNQWEWPSVKNIAPIPRAATASARVGDKVYIFGGRHKKLRMNDLFFIDMKHMYWHCIHPNEGQTVPIGRSWHSLTQLSDHQIVLFGGFTQDNRPLGTCHIFNVDSNTWNDIPLPFDKPRLWHSASMSPFGEILVFGGANQNILNLINLRTIRTLYSGDIITLRFAPKSLLRLCLDSVVSNLHSLQIQSNCLPQNMKKLLDMRKQTLLTNSAGS